jgi:hypothetical protein
MTVIRYLLIAIFIFSGWCEAKPQIKIVNDSLDFGIVPANSMFYSKIIIKSVGSDTLRIDSINPICPCINVPLSKEKYILPSGDSAIVEVSYDSEELVGSRNRYPHIFSNATPGRGEFIRFAVKAFLVDDMPNLKTIYVFPYRIAASQFGDIPIKEFPFKIINNSNENVPLRIIDANMDYYDLKFPVFVAPRDTAIGVIILNERGLKSEFEKSITFEFINGISEKKNYSIPVTRKIFRK